VPPSEPGPPRRPSPIPVSRLVFVARARRETYIGPWLPELIDTSADPYLGAERGEAMELAALLLMEKLTPNERAAYVLREAFDYPYAQIGDILRATEASAGKHSRASGVRR